MTAAIAVKPARHSTTIQFIWKQIQCCAFPLLFFVLLGGSRAIHLPGVARYDLIFVGALAIQLGMLVAKVETVDEAKTISLFHLLGLGLELFKVKVGSWSYPEAGLLKLGGVPLYSGFMYASVGSYVCQAWRRFNLQVNLWPPASQVAALGAALYLNFFAHHIIPDLRFFLCVLVVWVFRDVIVFFNVAGYRRSMPLLTSFLLIGCTLWVAENAATYLGAWQYPYQRDGWRLVELGKISSWSMLVIVSVILVAQLKKAKAELASR